MEKSLGSCLRRSAASLLLVLAARLAHAFQSFRRTIAVGLAAEVAEADDPAQLLVLFDDRQAADLRLALS